MSRRSSRASRLPTSNPAATKASASTKPRSSRASKDLRVSFPISLGRIKELFVSGENTIIVRGEATGTPIKTFLGAEPTGRSFRTMSIDLYTVTGSRISRSYHVENWTAALRQLAKD